jgi:glycosyltransferase involved in cell wall biosynthesis
MDKITFVLPSRNNLEFLQLAYKSIRNLKTKHQVLVLDDASTDGTNDWLKSLNDDDITIYSNPGPERIGIVGMFDKGIEMATTEIIFAFHADMVASPNLDQNILKHLKRGTVVCATRVEPPLHPSGPEKIILPLGNEVEEFNYDSSLSKLSELESEYKDKTTEGIFAPWCMYKDDYMNVGGHDTLFAPQSKEDSDLFNRFHLKGFKFIQSWDGLVYHFTSRGSRFNKKSGGDTGINSPEWIHTTTKNGRNFIRKWGHFVKHDEYMKPIVPSKYNIGFVVKNCTLSSLSYLELFCDNIYCDTAEKEISQYISDEQKNTTFNLSERVFHVNEFEGAIPPTDIVVYVDAGKLQNGSQELEIIQNLSQILDSEELEVGSYELGSLKVVVNIIKTYEKELIFIKNK